MQVYQKQIQNAHSVIHEEYVTREGLNTYTNQENRRDKSRRLRYQPLTVQEKRHDMNKNNTQNKEISSTLSGRDIIHDTIQISGYQYVQVYSSH